VRWREVWSCCVSGGVPRRSLAVALIVGAILNLINQGDALLSGAHLDFTKIVLTFAVPYCVATYGAVSYRLRLTPPVSSPKHQEGKHAAT
jgi:hypothetical protein